MAIDTPRPIESSMPALMVWYTYRPHGTPTETGATQSLRRCLLASGSLWSTKAERVWTQVWLLRSWRSAGGGRVTREGVD